MASTDVLTAGLENISDSPNFTRWMYEKIKPFIEGDILEVGSGIGVFSRFLYRDFSGKLYLTDINPHYLALLRNRFRDARVIVQKLDLSSQGDFQQLGQRFDTVVCMNVLEHIKDDTLALSRIREVLNEHGSLIVLVPVHRFLYNTIDVALGHYRRYARGELTSKLVNAGFTIYTVFYHDIFGIPGWYVNGNLLRKPLVNRSAFRYFDRLVPILRLLEAGPLVGTGISIIAICKGRLMM